MKILFCTNAFETVTNGPAKFAHILLRLSEYYPEHEVRVLTEDCIGDIPEKVYKLELAIPFYLRPAGQFLRMFRYHKRALAIRKRYVFDVLIYNYAMIGSWSAIRFSNTVVFLNDDCISTATIKNIFSEGLSKYHIFRIPEYIAAKYCKKVIVNSEYMVGHILREYPFVRGKIFKLTKCIEFSPVKRNNFKNSNEIRILFVKNDYARGGLYVLVDALKILKVSVRLIVAGTANAVREILEEKLQGTSVQLDFRGMQPQSTIYDLMLQADIFCVPSFKEALGVANIEAMALGCSIVSSRAGGIPEVLDGGRCGWMADIGDEVSLSEALLQCIENETEREEKREYAYNYVKKYNVKDTLGSFADIVEEVL